MSSNKGSSNGNSKDIHGKERGGGTGSSETVSYGTSSPRRRENGTVNSMADVCWYPRGSDEEGTTIFPGGSRAKQRNSA